MRYQPHGLIPIFEVGHHGEHDPQGAVGCRPEQGADLRLKLMGLAQAAADAPQAQLGGFQPPMDIGHGAVHTKIKGAHCYHTALCGGNAGLIEHELLLLVHRAARQHHIAAAQQAHAGSTCLQRRFNILLPVAVGQELKRHIILCPVGQDADAGGFRALPLQLADAADRLLAGVGIRVQNALAVVGIQHHGAAIAVVQERLPHLHHTGNVHGPRNDRRVALLIALRSDDAQDHPRRNAEQIAGHQHLCRQDHRVIQRHPDPGTVAQNIDHAAGGVQNIHAPQLHVCVVFHIGQPLGIAAAHPVHRLGGSHARLDLKTDFIHHALVFQHHALKQEDGLLGGCRALGHGIQLGLGRVDGLVQHPLFPLRVERPIAERFHMAFQTAHLAQHQPGRGRSSLINFHFSITSGSTGPVSTRYTSACKNVLGNNAARAASAARPLPSNSGAKLSMRSFSHFSRNALPSVSVV